MEAEGAKDGDAQVCAFMGISTSEREMSQLNLDGKVWQKSTCQFGVFIICILNIVLYLQGHKLFS